MPGIYVESSLEGSLVFAEVRDSRSPVSIEAMLDAADLAAPRMASLLVGVVSTLGS